VTMYKKVRPYIKSVTYRKDGNKTEPWVATKSKMAYDFEYSDGQKLTKKLLTKSLTIHFV